MSGYKIRPVVKDLNLGEGPHWDKTKQELIYVDIPDETVHRFVPSTGQDYHLPMGIFKKSFKFRNCYNFLIYYLFQGGRTTFIVPLESKPNNYLVGVERNIVQLEWDGVTSNVKEVISQSLLAVEENSPGNRFNDGKCDNQGRLWAG